MKVLLAVLTLCAGATAQTLTLAPVDILPSSPFTLTLSGPASLGASWYLKSTALLEVLSRSMLYDDPTVGDISNETISPVRSTDFGGSVDNFALPVDLRITLTLLAPADPGSFYISTDPLSILLLPDFSSTPIPAHAVQVNVVPEPPLWALFLASFGLLRIRPYEPSF